MKNETDGISSNSQGLAVLFALGRDFRPVGDEELRESLQHLLDLPIQSAINQLPRQRAAHLRGKAESSGAFAEAIKTGLATFGEVLRSTESPPVLARFAKEFGKAVFSEPNCTWPREVGRVLYYASYAAALLYHNQHPGMLTKEELQNGFCQFAKTLWVDEKTKRLFADANTHLGSKLRKQYVTIGRDANIKK
jgi:hypothetical protein